MGGPHRGQAIYRMGVRGTVLCLMGDRGRQAGRRATASGLGILPDMQQGILANGLQEHNWMRLLVITEGKML